MQLKYKDIPLAFKKQKAQFNLKHYTNKYDKCTRLVANLSQIFLLSGRDVVIKLS